MGGSGITELVCEVAGSLRPFATCVIGDRQQWLPGVSGAIVQFRGQCRIRVPQWFEGCSAQDCSRSFRAVASGSTAWRRRRSTGSLFLRRREPIRIERSASVSGRAPMPASALAQNTGERLGSICVPSPKQRTTVAERRCPAFSSARRLSSGRALIPKIATGLTARRTSRIDPWGRRARDRSHRQHPPSWACQSDNGAADHPEAPPSRNQARPNPCLLPGIPVFKPRVARGAQGWLSKVNTD